MSNVNRDSDVTMTPEVSRDAVASRLARYDLDRNQALARLHPPGQYPHTRRCAVLIPLFFHPSDGRLHVLLTVRSSTLRTHASHVAFPGGARDASDADDVHTALREAHEEVGLAAGDVTVVARLPPVFVLKKNSAFPVVGFIPGHFVPRPNPHEVALVFSVPLADFVRDGAVTYSAHSLHGMRFTTSHLTHRLTPDEAGGGGGGGGVSVNVWGVTCNLCICVARAVLGPCKRHKLLLLDDGDRDGDGNGGGGAEAEEAAAAAAARRRAGDGDGSGGGGGGDKDGGDEDVFGDMVLLYHRVCKLTSGFPSGRL